MFGVRLLPVETVPGFAGTDCDQSHLVVDRPDIAESHSYYCACSDWFDRKRMCNPEATCRRRFPRQWCAQPRQRIAIARAMLRNPRIEVYLPFVEEPAPYLGLVVRSAGDPRTLASSVSAAVRAIDPNQPVAEVAGMRETLGEFFARPRFNLVLLGSFAALALTLSLIGIYAVISHSVTQRTNEIGIRIALGAQRRNVLFLFLRDGALVAVAGISIGLIGALAATRLLTAMLFGIAPQDGVTFAAVSLMFLIICLSASYFPARRALKVDPIVALRHE